MNTASASRSAPAIDSGRRHPLRRVGPGCGACAIGPEICRRTTCQLRRTAPGHCKVCSVPPGSGHGCRKVRRGEAAGPGSGPRKGDQTSRKRLSWWRARGQAVVRGRASSAIRPNTASAAPPTRNQIERSLGFPVNVSFTSEANESLALNPRSNRMTPATSNAAPRALLAFMSPAVSQRSCRRPRNATRVERHVLGTPVHGRLLPAEPVMADAPHRCRLQTFAGVCLVVAALYLAREVLIPFALAALISFLLAPMAARFERLIGRVAAVVVTVMIAFGVLSGVGWIVAGQMTELAAMLPEYRENIANKLGSLRGGVIEQATTTVKEIEQEVQRREKEAKEARQAEEAERAQDRPQSALQPEAGGSPQPKPEEPIRVEVMEPEPSALELIGGAFAPLLGPLGTAGMVIVLVAFMLLARADLRDRIIRLMGRTRIHLTTEAITDAGQRVSRYLLMQTVINGIHGVAVGVGMFFFGVPSFLLWGLLSAVLRFIPYIGPWVAAALPILVSFAVFDGWTQPLLVLGYFIVLELLSNNVLEP